MRQYQMQKKQEIEKIICNKCGKEIDWSGKIKMQDVLSVDKRWGYFSEKDNEMHHFDLCEECYDELVHSFIIPVDVE